MADGMPTPIDATRPNDPVLSVRGLRKYYPVTSGVLNRHVGDVKAVDGVSFDLYRGETLAVVGESGCGKSTLAETVLNLEEPSDGAVYYDGQPLAARSGRALQSVRRDLQMVFQDPFTSLNERMTVHRIVREPLDIHGVGSGERDEHVADLLGRVGLNPADVGGRFPHELSGGQRQRVCIARALALNPAVLVADEPVSALDVSVQAQILELLGDLQADLGLSYLFISHDLSVVRHLADRILVMYLGEVVEIADVDELFENPQHPYTEALLSDIPQIAPREERHEPIELEGSPPDPADPPSGCRFHTRCHVRASLDEADAERCVAESPRLGDGRGHCVACHFRGVANPSPSERGRENHLR